MMITTITFQFRRWYIRCLFFHFPFPFEKKHLYSYSIENVRHSFLSCLSHFALQKRLKPNCVFSHQLARKGHDLFLPSQHPNWMIAFKKSGEPKRIRNSFTETKFVQFMVRFEDEDDHSIQSNQDMFKQFLRQIDAFGETTSRSRKSSRGGGGESERIFRDGPRWW